MHWLGTIRKQNCCVSLHGVCYLTESLSLTERIFRLPKLQLQKGQYIFWALSSGNPETEAKVPRNIKSPQL